MSKELEFKQRISFARNFENTLPEYPLTGEKKWVVSKGRCWPRCLEDGEYIYVVMPETGEIRFSEKPKPLSNINHPELCNGREVLGAGLFKLSHGKVEKFPMKAGIIVQMDYQCHM